MFPEYKIKELMKRDNINELQAINYLRMQQHIRSQLRDRRSRER